MFSTAKAFLQTMHAILFKQNRFYCRIPMGNNLDFVLYEKPGIWCNQKELDELVATLRDVAQRGQGSKEIPDYGVLKGEKFDLNRRIISIAYDRKTGQAIGFSAQAYLDVQVGLRYETVIHLGLIFIDPQFQGRNLSYILSSLPNILIFLKSGLRSIWLSSVSQVPAVVGLVAQNYYAVYPNYNSQVVQTFEHRMLAREIIKHHRSFFGVGAEATYDEDRQIIQNAYTGGSDHLKKSFADAPKHRIDSVNNLCQMHLNYERGDDFLQIGRLNLKAFLIFSRARFAKNISGQLLINLVFFAIAGVIAPTLRWLLPVDSQRET